MRWFSGRLLTTAAACVLPLACGDGANGGRATDASTTPPQSLAEVTHLIGEIHLHQFPLGSHGWAGFLADPVPRTSAVGDQLVAYEPAPTSIEGPCTLYVQPTCDPGCTGDTLCLGPNTCTPYSAVRYVDIGDVHIVGSRVVNEIRMFFAGASGPYECDPPAGRGHLFEGGESLHVAGGEGDLAFDGTLTAPKPVVVTTPDLTHDLHFGTDALSLAWETEHSLQMVITLTASSSNGDGAAATIRCSTSDTGALTVPASMMSRLPRSPRDLRLEIERNDERILPTARRGVGVIVHAAQSTWKNGKD